MSLYDSLDFTGGVRSAAWKVKMIQGYCDKEEITLNANPMKIYLISR